MNINYIAVSGVEAFLFEAMLCYDNYLEQQVLSLLHSAELQLNFKLILVLMFSFFSLDNRTEENHTETIVSNYWNTLPVH